MNADAATAGARRGMGSAARSAARTAAEADAPPGRDYSNRVLVLQGGGALGSYQAGVFEQLVASGIQLNWVAGISIGAINAALIAGNAPARRVEQLHAFWDGICRQPVSPWMPAMPDHLPLFDPEHLPDGLRRWMSMLQSTRALVEGQAGFFTPRHTLPPLLHGTGGGAASYYDTAPLAATLERLVDFDRINHPGAMRVSVGAVQVSNGDLVYFDNRAQRLDVRHVMASAALPPAFPAVDIDGELYWDGGVLMNTPLIHVLRSEPRHDTLVFQVDLWNAEGPLPTSLPEVEERKKDIVFSSRTRMVNDYMREQQDMRKCIADLLELVPPQHRRHAAAVRAQRLACDRRCNVQQLICTDTRFEGSAKDYEFGAATMRRHWNSGIADLRRLLADSAALAMPDADAPFKVHTAAAPSAASTGRATGLPHGSLHHA